MDHQPPAALTMRTPREHLPGPGAYARDLELLTDMAPAHGPRLYLQPLAAGADNTRPLNKAQEQRLNTITNPTRRLEYRLSRQLLQRALARECPGRDNHQVPAAGPLLLPPEWGRYAAMAHSDGLAVCGLYQRPLGLDLEPRNRILHWQALAERWFTPREQACLAALPPATGKDRFLLLWTLKEAWLKATHQGIANNLQQLQLTQGAADPSRWQLSLPANNSGWQAGVLVVSGYWLSLLWQPEEPSATKGPAAPAMPQAPPWQLHTPLQCRQT
ncbi:MAG: 4'-phosphopantetheinyl transferase superfamily protein [Halomonadaceae bacterium]|nr:MAG: 4'-phosphopantetheinyl transferase superfamily protein [Halomonadaceae bacterium]